MAEFDSVNLRRVRGITLGVAGGVYVLLLSIIYWRRYGFEDSLSEENQIINIGWFLTFALIWVGQWLVLAGKRMPHERSSTGMLVGLGVIFGLLDGMWAIASARALELMTGEEFYLDEGVGVVIGGIGFGLGLGFVLFSGRALNRYIFTRNLGIVHLLYPILVVGGVKLTESVGVHADQALRSALLIPLATILFSGLALVVWAISPAVYLIAYMQSYRSYKRKRDGAGDKEL